MPVANIDEGLVAALVKNDDHTGAVIIERKVLAADVKRVRPGADQS